MSPSDDLDIPQASHPPFFLLQCDKLRVEKRPRPVNQSGAIKNFGPVNFTLIHIDMVQFEERFLNLTEDWVG